MRFDMWKSKAQKGAFLVFTALMIPIIFICAGFAVDLGNAWAYKSKLQNAADAAALAGAKEYGDNGTESVDDHKHDEADAQAERFLIANLGNDYFKEHLADGSTGKVRYQMKPLTQNDSTKTYYRVYLSAQTDTSFMKMFNYKHMDVGVEAVAVVPSKAQDVPSGKPTFEDMVVFRDGLDAGGTSFNNENQNGIVDTFDGDIVTTGRYRWDYYTDWRYKFYTSKAAGMKMDDANKLQQSDGSYYSTVIPGQTKAYEQFYENINNEIIQMYNSETNIVNYPDQNIRIPPQNSSNKTNFYLVNNSDSNANIEVYSLKDTGNIDEPIYLYISGTKGNININVHEDTGRPLIICYPGHKYIDRNGQLRSTTISLNQSGVKFRGVLYAPYSEVLHNVQNGAFTGTLITDFLRMQANHSKYVFEPFYLFGNKNHGGGGSGGQTGPSTKLQLVISDKEGLKWSDD
jgi:hypothetical protein